MNDDEYRQTGRTTRQLEALVDMAIKGERVAFFCHVCSFLNYCVRCIEEILVRRKLNEIVLYRHTTWKVLLEVSNGRIDLFVLDNCSVIGLRGSIYKCYDIDHYTLELAQFNNRLFELWMHVINSPVKRIGE